MRISDFGMRHALLVAVVLLALLPMATAAEGADTYLQLKPDRLKYRAGETVHLTASLAVDGGPVPGNVTIQVEPPTGGPFLILTGTAGASGRAAFNFTLPENATHGRYTVYGTAIFPGGIVSSSTAFTLFSRTEEHGQEDWLIPGITGATAAMLMAGAVAGVAATEPGRYGFYALVAPLYTRVRKDDALDNSVRHKVHGFIEENPGEHYSAVRTALDLSNGALTYHLSVLEREGFLHSSRDGTLLRFYPAGVKAPSSARRGPEEIRNGILALIKKHPGISQKDLIRRMAVGREVVGYHLREAVKEGRVVAWKRGRTRVYRVRK